MHVVFVVLKSLFTIVPSYAWIILFGVVMVWGIVTRNAWQVRPT